MPNPSINYHVPPLLETIFSEQKHNLLFQGNYSAALRWNRADIIQYSSDHHFKHICVAWRLPYEYPQWKGYMCISWWLSCRLMQAWRTTTSISAQLTLMITNKSEDATSSEVWLICNCNFTIYDCTVTSRSLRDPSWTVEPVRPVRSLWQKTDCRDVPVDNQQQHEKQTYTIPVAGNDISASNKTKQRKANNTHNCISTIAPPMYGSLIMKYKSIYSNLPRTIIREEKGSVDEMISNDLAG